MPGIEGIEQKLIAELIMLASVQRDGILFNVRSVSFAPVQRAAQIARKLGDTLACPLKVGDPSDPIWRVDFRVSHRASQFLTGKIDLCDL